MLTAKALLKFQSEKPRSRNKFNGGEILTGHINPMTKKIITGLTSLMVEKNRNRSSKVQRWGYRSQSYKLDGRRSYKSNGQKLMEEGLTTNPSVRDFENCGTLGWCNAGSQR